LTSIATSSATAAAKTEPPHSPLSIPEQRGRRRVYIDWMRGLAVLIMIFAHTMDSWTRADDRGTSAYRWTIILGGFGAPLFLFLAGVAVPLAASAKMRKTADVWTAARTVSWRGVEIFALAFLFRLQSFVLSPGASLMSLMKVDILNIMGPAIAAAALLWGATSAQRVRRLLFAAAMLGACLIAPIVRSTMALDFLPDPIQWYFQPAPNRANFILFPWIAFVFAGALIGTLLDDASSPLAEKRLSAALVVFGSAIAIAAYVASFQPSLYPRSEFWTSSPSFFFIRIGILLAALGLIYFLAEFGVAPASEAMEQLGRTSLFIYWVHVEMVYGLLTYPLRRQLPFGWSLVAFVLFSYAMYRLSVFKTRLTRQWRTPSDRSAFTVFRSSSL
jgi:uncharacterized membrane protein